MKFFYNAIYLALLVVLSPWVVWRMVVQRKNRRGWKQKLAGFVPTRNSDRRCAWIHAVSVGEVNLLVPFVDAFREQFPEFDIAISTTTETGFDLAQQRFPNDHLFFCPADFSWAVNKTLDRIRPEILILTELEIWPNLISLTRSRQIPVALINGRVSWKSYNGYRRLRHLLQHVLRDIDVAAVQTPAYAERLTRLGMPPDRIKICGNIKFDGSGNQVENSARSAELAALAQFADDDFIFLAGSTQENEDRIAISIFQSLSGRYPELRMILAPRHPDRCNRLAGILRDNALPFVFRSTMESEHPPESRILVIDIIGELADWWGAAAAGYVGGSMGGRGGQNMIEPAARGVPICFGPETDNFRDVVQLLLADQAAVEVADESQWKQFLIDVIEDRHSAKMMGQRGRQLVAGQRGAAVRTVSLLEPLLDQGEKRPRHAA